MSEIGDTVCLSGFSFFRFIMPSQVSTMEILFWLRCCLDDNSWKSLSDTRSKTKSRSQNEHESALKKFPRYFFVVLFCGTFLHD